MFDALIVGGGVLGALLAYRFSFYEGKCLVLEKENDVCSGASSANSGIVHSGYDPKPGSLKARYNLIGRKMMPALCEELGVPCKNIGSLTVALEDQDLSVLDELLGRAKENGVEASIIGKEKLWELEPNISEKAVAALYCPEAGVVDPFLLTARAMESAIDNGVELHLSEEAMGIRKIADGYEVITDKGRYETKALIVAAGPYTEKLTSTLGIEGYGSRVRKGNYYVLDKTSKPVSHVVFPLPSSKGKGILVIPTTSGTFLVGPDSTEHEGFDDVSTTEESLKAIMEGAKRLVPMVDPSMGIRVYAGNRSACASGDFIIGEKKGLPGFVYLAGIDSPGLTAAPAIATDVIENRIVPYIRSEPKDSGKRVKTKHHRPMSMPIAEREAFYERDRRYSKIVCACEKVSLGEVEDALNSSLPCYSLKALKKRTGAGFGKCQGGFCGPNLIAFIAKRWGIKEGEVLYDKEGSRFSMEEIRDGSR